MWNRRGGGKASLTVVPGDGRLHSLSRGEKVNAPLKPEWGEVGASNDWCITCLRACGYEFYLRVFNLISHAFAELSREI